MRQHVVDSDEFDDFYASSKDQCFRTVIACGLSAAAAEEALAEGFARAWAAWPQVREFEQPKAWVVRAAVNANISWWRRRRREVALSDVSDVGDASDVSGAPDASSLVLEGTAGSHDLIVAIRELPQRQREVVALRYLLDLDTAATARWLGIAPGTVTAHLHHALTALRSQLTTREPSR